MYEQETESDDRVCGATVKQEHTDIETQSVTEFHMLQSKPETGIDGTESPRKLHFIKTEDGEMQCLNCMSAVLDVEGHYIYCSKNRADASGKLSLFGHSKNVHTSKLGSTHIEGEVPNFKTGFVDSTASSITNDGIEKEHPADGCTSIVEEELRECSKCNVYFNDRHAYLDHKLYTCIPLEDSESLANGRSNTCVTEDEGLYIKVEKFDEHLRADEKPDIHNSHTPVSELTQHSARTDATDCVNTTLESFTCSCPYCKSTFDDFNALNFHTLSCQGPDIGLNTNEFIVRKITCPICSVEFNTRFEYSQHIVSSHILKNLEQGQEKNFSKTESTSNAYKTHLQENTIRATNEKCNMRHATDSRAQHAKHLQDLGLKEYTEGSLSLMGDLDHLRDDQIVSAEKQKRSTKTDNTTSRLKRATPGPRKYVSKSRKKPKVMYACLFGDCRQRFESIADVLLHEKYSHMTSTAAENTVITSEEKVDPCETYVKENTNKQDCKIQLNVAGEGNDKEDKSIRATLHPCSRCSKKFSEQQELLSHTILKHPQLLKKCRWKNCGANFFTEAALKSHVQTHLVNQCTFCSFICHGAGELRAHLSENHTDVVCVKNPTFPVNIAKNSDSVCDSVYEGFDLENTLLPYKCSAQGCKKAFLFKRDLKRHMQNPDHFSQKPTGN